MSFPVPSFAEQGQRIRLPEDVLSGKMATCLDAALLYAGCLEAPSVSNLICFFFKILKLWTFSWENKSDVWERNGGVGGNK